MKTTRFINEVSYFFYTIYITSQHPHNDHQLNYN